MSKCFSKCAAIATLVIGVQATAWAQKYSNEFLNIGVGARAAGMGNVGVASVSDGTAGFWNPAGLTYIKSDAQVSFMHAEWFGSVANYDYASYAMPIADKRRALAFTFIRLGVDNIPNTLQLVQADGSVDYSRISSFSAADYAFMGSYAQIIGSDDSGLSIGGTAKVVHRTFGPFGRSWGFGADLGVQYRKNGLLLGLMGKDLTGTFNAWSYSFTDADRAVLLQTNNEIPKNTLEVTRPSFQLGGGYEKDFVLGEAEEGKRAKSIGFLAEANLNLTTDGKRNTLIKTNAISIDPYLGVELNYSKMIFLRTGFNNLQQVKDLDNNSQWKVQPNFGLGLKLWAFRLDYALSNSKSATGLAYSHLVSATVDLDFEYLKKQIDKGRPK